jgi:hypothetical protein
MKQHLIIGIGIETNVSIIQPAMGDQIPLRLCGPEQAA